MASDYAVFIVSHGRPDNIATLNALRKGNYSSDTYIIIDNEDDSAEEYKRRYGNMVIQFDVWFLKTDRPFRFVGRVNEDTNTYVMLGNQGKLFFTVTNTQITQAQTQKNAEGMTTLYLDYGTYVKSFYSVIVAPQAVRVAEMGAHHQRMHHRVDWNKCVPKIISDRYRKWR